MLTSEQTKAIIREMKADEILSPTREELVGTFTSTAKQMFDLVVPQEDALVAVARAFPRAS